MLAMPPFRRLAHLLAALTLCGAIVFLLRQPKIDRLEPPSPPHHDLSAHTNDEDYQLPPDVPMYVPQKPKTKAGPPPTTSAARSSASLPTDFGLPKAEPTPPVQLTDGDKANFSTISPSPGNISQPLAVKTASTTSIGDKPKVVQPSVAPAKKPMGHENVHDPDRWRDFPWNNAIYNHSGIGRLMNPHMGSDTGRTHLEAYMPYPAYNTEEWHRQWRSDYVPCKGPNGKTFNSSSDEIPKAYPALSSGFPNAAIGWQNVTGSSAYSRCIDRYHRYGPYGYGRDERRDIEDWQQPLSQSDWSTVDWLVLQDACFASNLDRYQPAAERRPGSGQKPSSKPLPHQPRYHSRTAIVIRIQEGQVVGDDELYNIRAMTTELALHSGAEYQVFILIHLSTKSSRSQRAEQNALNSLPKELRSISILWTSQICQEWYPGLGDCDNFWHPYAPLQWFALNNTGFDFVWNWELDVRYTGNYYELLEGISSFSRNSPRKYLWERNQQFYVPKVHKSYQAFLKSTHRSVERAIRKGAEAPWGWLPWNTEVQKPIGPEPPRSLHEDKFEWGVGEDADLITLQPIWDPRNVAWRFKNKIWNFIPEMKPALSTEEPLAWELHHPDHAKVPRRATVGQHMRFSARQLYAMHLENVAGRSTAAEMWPATVALHHGLKAVYVPQPVWTDRIWPARYLDKTLNADGDQFAQWGQGSDSVWSDGRRNNLAGMSWYVGSEFASTLYRRWLGLPGLDDNPVFTKDGEEWEEEGVRVDIEIDGNGTEMKTWFGGQGRMCLPPMLLQAVNGASDKFLEKG